MIVTLRSAGLDILTLRGWVEHVSTCLAELHPEHEVEVDAWWSADGMDRVEVGAGFVDHELEARVYRWLDAERDAFLEGAENRGAA